MVRNDGSIMWFGKMVRCGAWIVEVRYVGKVDRDGGTIVVVQFDSIVDGYGGMVVRKGDSIVVAR